MEIEDFKKLTPEDMATKYNELQSEAKKGYIKRDEFKASLILANENSITAMDELNILKDINTKRDAKESGKKLYEFVKNLPIQEKFVEDVIYKSKITFDMDDTTRNIAIKDIMDKFPEYRQNKQAKIETNDKDEAKGETDFKTSYETLIKEAQKGKK
jgi:hypothetical protein